MYRGNLYRVNLDEAAPIMLPEGMREIDLVDPGVQVPGAFQRVAVRLLFRLFLSLSLSFGVTPFLLWPCCWSNQTFI